MYRPSWNIQERFILKRKPHEFPSNCASGARVGRCALHENNATLAQQRFRENTLLTDG
jgi:hypothetical protein